MIHGSQGFPILLGKPFARLGLPGSPGKKRSRETCVMRTTENVLKIYHQFPTSWIHVWYICINFVDFYGELIGKYTSPSPMDPSWKGEEINQPSSPRASTWQPWRLMYGTAWTAAEWESFCFFGGKCAHLPWKQPVLLFLPSTWTP